MKVFFCFSFVHFLPWVVIGLHCVVHFCISCVFVFQSEAVKVCVTGAAGQIAYSLLYSLAKGDVFGSTQVWSLLLFYLDISVIYELCVCV